MKKNTRKRSSKDQVRRPKKDQVRVWLNTVIAPMLSALAVESERAGRNWSFRAGPEDFEFFWATDMMIGPYYAANRDQFFRYHPDVAELARRHDAAREELRDACERAFHRVQQSAGFQEQAQDVDEPDRRYLAEYLVNGIESLSRDYSLSEYWSKNGRAYLDLAERDLGESWREIDQKGAEVREAIAALRARLERLQVTLSDEFGLPPVDPAGPVMA